MMQKAYPIFICGNRGGCPNKFNDFLSQICRTDNSLEKIKKKPQQVKWVIQLVPIIGLYPLASSVYDICTEPEGNILDSPLCSHYSFLWK